MRHPAFRVTAFVGAIGVIGMFASAALTAHAAGGTNVVISDSTSSAANGASQAGSPVHFTATFAENGASTEHVMLDLELYRTDASGGPTKVAQAYRSVTLAPGQTNRFSLDLPATASAGSYVLKGGIFSSDWSQTLSWSDSVQKVRLVPAGSPPPDNDVVMTSSAVGSPAVLIDSQPEGFTSTLSSPNAPNTVLIDIEAYDPSGTRVYQTFTDNASFPAGGSRTFTAELPHTLTEGTYHWSVGIFTPGWGKLINWYDAAQTFQSADQVPSHPGLSVADSGLPSSPVPVGQSFTISPELVNSGGTASQLYIYVSLYDAANGVNGGGITYDSQTLPDGTPVAFPLTASASLPPGTYDAKIAIFPDYLGNVKHANYFTVGTVTVQ